MKQPILEEKALLTVRETATVFNLSYRKMFALVQQKNLPFLVWYKERKLIIKDEFIKYLARPGVKEGLAKYVGKNTEKR